MSFTSRCKRISRKQLPINIKIRKNRTVGPRRNNRRILLNQTAPAFRKIKARQKTETAQVGKGLRSNPAKSGFEL